METTDQANGEANFVSVEAGTNVGPEHDSYNPETGDKTKISATLDFNVGNSLDEAVEMYGEDVVFERWTRQVKRDLGNAIRSSLNSGKTPSAVEDELADWRPDVTRRSSGSKEKDLVTQFQDLSQDEKEAKLQELMALVGA